MIIYNDICTFCKSESTCNETIVRFRTLYCNKCQFKIEYSYSKPATAISFLLNSSFRFAELNLPPLNSKFDTYVVYNFFKNKLELFDYFYKPMFSTFIKPDINLIKSIALKYNKLSKYA